MNKRLTGRYGEDLAIDYLKKNGYKIIETNFSCNLGEIDIVAKDGKTLCFIEVKYRQSDNYGSPLEAVDSRKASKIAKTAQYYCLVKNIKEVPMRIDVVGIISSEGKADIVLVRNAIIL